MERHAREMLVRANDDEVLKQRRAKYLALADVFGRATRSLTSVIPVLSLPCVPSQPCPVCLRPLATAAALAKTWCENDVDLARLDMEYERLFVSSGSRSAVSPYAQAYLPLTAEAIREAVSGYYRRMDFPGQGHGALDDPLHIASQLGFMGHCLEREQHGLSSRLDGELFFADQLLPWGPMFARAAYAATSEPVFRFASLALEQLLKCEAMVLLPAASGA